MRIDHMGSTAVPELAAKPISSYVGYACLAWLALVLFFLSDMVLNRARVSTGICNGMFNLLGSASSLVPSQ